MTFNEQQVHAVPALRRSAREHLAVEPVYQTASFLEAFSNCGGIDFIELLLAPDRRWWIGSVLQTAELLLADEEYQMLKLLFRKILRGMDCGHPIPEGDIGVCVDGLSFAPEIDTDLRFGRWEEGDCTSAKAILSRLGSMQSTFTRPVGPIGIAPEDAEWQDWVTDKMRSVLRLSELAYSSCNVFSFIG